MATTTTASGPTAIKPIRLYDHLPGILAGLPALGFLILAGLSLAREKNWEILSSDTVFWIGLIIGLAWYLAFRFNLPKRRFFLVFGLAGTFLGIPVVLELVGKHRFFSWLAERLGLLAPSASPGAWLVMSIVFAIIWLSNLIWSRTHMSVTIDESGLMIKRAGGKSERFELIGLKTETEPLDYTETFLLGIGSLTLKSRLNKQIFTMKRVIGLYRIPLVFWKQPLIKRIDEMLSYQGKVLAVDPDERIDMAEAADVASTEDDAALDVDHDVDHEIDARSEGEFSEAGEVDTPDSPDVK